MLSYFHILNATEFWNMVLHSGVNECRHKVYSHRLQDLKSHISVYDYGLLICDTV
jgi:hypothetical protein